MIHPHILSLLNEQHPDGRDVVEDVIMDGFAVRFNPVQVYDEDMLGSTNADERIQFDEIAEIDPETWDNDLIPAGIDELTAADTFLNMNGEDIYVLYRDHN